MTGISQASLSAGKVRVKLRVVVKFHFMLTRSSTQTPPIIDVHTHPVFMGEGASAGELRALVRRARGLGICRMVALGDVLRYGRLPTATQVRAINDETRAVVAATGGMFLGFVFLNPRLGARAVEREVARAVEGWGAAGIKLEICNNAADTRWMTPVMTAAARWDLPVLQHSWSQTNIRERSFHTDPEDTCRLARRHPEVRLIMAHLTGCGRRGVKAARGLRNVWVDTSGGAPEAGLVEYAVEQVGADRVLYGSDAPIRDLPVAIARITGAAIKEEAKRAILYDNARALLRLP